MEKFSVKVANSDIIPYFEKTAPANLHGLQPYFIQLSGVHSENRTPFIERSTAAKFVLLSDVRF